MLISDWSSAVCSSDLGVIKREKTFATAGNDACPIDAKLSFFPHQPELHRMPVKPRQPVQRAILQTAQAPAPISLHIIGEDRVREQGHMAKDIMEHEIGRASCRERVCRSG